MNNDLASVLRGLVQQLNQQQQSPTPPPSHNYENNIVNEFRRFHPPTLTEKESPIEIENWIRALEKIFAHLASTDKQKVSCAIFQLIEEADFWWEAHCRTMTDVEKAAITWEEFTKAMIKNYVPQSFLDQKEIEFLHLR